MLIIAAISLLLVLCSCAGPRARWNGGGQRPGSRPLSHSPGNIPPAFIPVPRIASF